MKTLLQPTFTILILFFVCFLTTSAQLLVAAKDISNDTALDDQFTFFLSAQIVDQKSLVRSARLHELMPGMQCPVASWHIPDSKDLTAVKGFIKIPQYYPAYGYESNSRTAYRQNEMLVAPVVTERMPVR